MVEASIVETREAGSSSGSVLQGDESAAGEWLLVEVELYAQPFAFFVQMCDGIAH
jgi:hypothetical protein